MRHARRAKKRRRSPDCDGPLRGERAARAARGPSRSRRRSCCRGCRGCRGRCSRRAARARASRDAVDATDAWDDAREDAAAHRSSHCSHCSVRERDRRACRAAERARCCCSRGSRGSRHAWGARWPTLRAVGIRRLVDGPHCDDDSDDDDAPRTPRDDHDELAVAGQCHSSAADGSHAGAGARGRERPAGAAHTACEVARNLAATLTRIVREPPTGGEAAASMEELCGTETRTCQVCQMHRRHAPTPGGLEPHLRPEARAHASVPVRSRGANRNSREGRARPSTRCCASRLRRRPRTRHSPGVPSPRRRARTPIRRGGARRTARTHREKECVCVELVVSAAMLKWKYARA